MKLHLPKKLFAAVMALFAIGVNTTLGADTISINFGTTTVATTSTGDVGGVEAAYWNNITGGNAGAVSKTWDLITAGGVSYSGGITVNTTHSPWGPRGDQSTVLNAVQSSYLDCTNHTPTQWTLDLNIDENIAELLVDKAYLPGMGARPIIREIQNVIEKRISDFLLTYEGKPILVRVYCNNNTISFKVEEYDKTKNLVY